MMVLPHTSSCLLLLSLVMMALSCCYSFDYSDYMSSPAYRSDALRTLKYIKKRLHSSYGLSKRGRVSRRACRRWNEPCVPWTKHPEEDCCDPNSQICQCNLWMQNCRCNSRLWG